MPPKAEASKVQVGDYLMLFSYYKVLKKDEKWIHVKDEKGNKLQISRTVVDKSMASTNQYSREEEVTQKTLAEKIGSAGHAAFRCTFKKAVESNSIADAVASRLDEFKGSQAKRRKVMKELMQGEERVMHCKLCRSGESTELGRYQVIDLEAQDDGKPPVRLVDTRTVSELILEGVRYFVKSK